MATLTSSLIVRLIDQVSAPAKKASRSLTGIGGAIKRLTSGGLTAGLTASLTSAQKRLGQLRAGMLEAVAGFFVLQRALLSPINAARQFQSALTDVKKVVDGFQGPAGRGALASFTKEIIELSKRVPVAVTALSGIAAIGAQAGIATTELIAFTTLVAEAAEAFQVDTETMGAALGKLKTALKLSIPGVRLLAGHMNTLANNMATTEADVLEVVRRVAALGGVSGVNAKSIAALGAAMSASGVDAEVAATATRNLLIELQSGPAATKSTRLALKELGLEASQVAKDMQEDGPGVILDIFDRIVKKSPEVQAALLNQLFGKRAVDALGPLIGNLDTLRKAYGLVADDARGMNAVQKEASVRFQDFNAKLQIFQNRLMAVKIAIGNNLLPALTTMMTTLAPVIDRIAELAAAYPQLTTAIVAGTAAIVAFRVAAISMSFVGAQFKVTLLQMALAATKFGGIMKGAALLPLVPFRAALQRVVGTAQIAALRFRLMGAAARSGTLTFSALATGTLATVTRGMVALLNPIKLVTGAVRLLGVALVANPIGAILTAIGAAGLFIFNNWKGVTAMFEGFKSAFVEAMGPIPDILKPVGNVLGTIFDSVSNLLGPLEASEEKWRSWGATLGKVAGGGVRLLVNGLAKLVGWIKDIIAFGGKAVGAIKGLFSSGGARTQGPKTESVSPARPGNPRKRARGGNVNAGERFEVNEKGQEFFTPGRTGRISPAQATPAGAVVDFRPQITLQMPKDTTPEDMMDKVRAMLKESAKETFEGLYGDTSFRFA